MILFEQDEEAKSIALFQVPEVKPLIEKSGQIYDSTIFFSYF